MVFTQWSHSFKTSVYINTFIFHSISYYLLQLDIWNAIVHLQPLFKGGARSGSWRTHNEFFKSSSKCLSKPGIVTMSPAWFELGHDVSVFYNHFLIHYSHQ